MFEDDGSSSVLVFRTSRGGLYELPAHLGKVTPAQTARVCVWWAMWSLLAMQATVCNGLSFHAPNQTVNLL